MEKDAHYFWVGLFVVVTLTMLTGFVIWLMGTQGNARDYEHYTVYFTDAVTGLEEGSNILYQGVKVGKVMKLRLDKEQANLVKVDAEIARDAPVHAGTRAQIEMQGITGLVHLELKTDPQDKKPPLHKKDERYPVIQGTGSQWTQAMDDLPVITQHIREITAKINSLLNKQTIERLSKFLGG
jgi:phospholipid/cholesterol/gamma-HCH transport system substrate-binding protein